jgi:adenosylmethionine-8-amino-7-oxononanoate aminotransferase
MGAYFLDRLQSLAHHPIVGEVRGTGLWAVIDLTTDKARRAPFPADRLKSIVERAKQQGMIIKFMNTALEFAPPLVITKADIDEAVRILDRCITEEQKAMGL